MIPPPIRRYTFRPAVSMHTARAVILAALDDEGLALAARAAGGRPQLWLVRDEPGECVVILDERAIRPKGGTPA